MAGASIFELGGGLDVWTMTICLTIVVFMTLLFEGLLGVLEHWIQAQASDLTADVYNKMLQKLYKELMILGFISFVLAMLIHTDSIKDKNQLLSFEYTHVVVFFVALSLMIQAVAITLSAYAVKKRCHVAQHLSLEGMIKSLEERPPSRSIIWHVFCYCWSFRKKSGDGSKEIRVNFFDIWFHLLRTIFIQTFELPQEFDFAYYYGMVQDSVVVATMDIDMTSWLILILILMINAAIQKSSQNSDCDTVHNTTVADGQRSLGASASASPCTDHSLGQDSVIIFAVFGWSIMGAIVLTIIWARRILQKILCIAGVKDVGSTESFRQGLMLARRRMSNYSKDGDHMSEGELRGALLKMDLENQKEQHNKNVLQHITEQVKEVAEDTQNTISQLGEASVGVAKAVAAQSERAAKTIATSSVAAVKGIAEGTVVATTAAAKTVKCVAKPLGNANSKKDPVRGEKESSSSANSTGFDVAATARDGAPASAPATAAPLFGNNNKIVPLSNTSKALSKGFASRSQQHFELLLHAKGSLRNAVSPLEIAFFTRCIDLLMLLNCMYLAVFVCSFAHATPQITAGLGGVTYSMLMLLPNLLNITVLIPGMIFVFSLVMSVCKLDIAALAVVLDQSEEMHMHLAELQSKITTRMEETGKTPDNMRAAFAKMDTDRSGSVNKHEFRDTLTELNVFLPMASIDRLFRAMDINKNNELDYEEFQQFMYSHDKEADEIEAAIQSHLEQKSEAERKKYIGALARMISQKQVFVVRRAEAIEQKVRSRGPESQRRRKSSIYTKNHRDSDSYKSFFSMESSSRSRTVSTKSSPLSRSRTVSTKISPLSRSRTVES